MRLGSLPSSGSYFLHCYIHPHIRIDTHTQSATVVFKKTSISVSVPFHHHLCAMCPGFPLLYETYRHQKSYLASWLFSIHDTACSLEKWLVMRGTSQASTAEAENLSWLVFVPVAAVSIRGGCWVNLKARKTQLKLCSGTLVVQGMLKDRLISFSQFSHL